MGKRASLALTTYERRALRGVARARGVLLFHVATAPGERYPTTGSGYALLRTMSLGDIVAEYEKLKAEGKAA